MGGDEFVVYVDGLRTELTTIQRVTERILKKIPTSLNGVYQLGDVVHHGSASIGIRLIDSVANNDLDQIVKDADAAMYAAKAARPR